MSNANARIDLRLPPEIKAMAQKASSLAGSTNLSEFVVQAIREKSMQIMTEMQNITLESEAFDKFWQACEDPAPYNAALRAARERHQQRIDHGELTYRTPSKDPS